MIDCFTAVHHLLAQLIARVYLSACLLATVMKCVW